MPGEGELGEVVEVFLAIGLAMSARHSRKSLSTPFDCCSHFDFSPLGFLSVGVIRFVEQVWAI